MILSKFIGAIMVARTKLVDSAMTKVTLEFSYRRSVSQVMGWRTTKHDAPGSILMVAFPPSIGFNPIQYFGIHRSAGVLLLVFLNCFVKHTG